MEKNAGIELRSVDNNDPSQGPIGLIARVLAAVAIVCSAFHFWPFPDSKLWQTMNLSNLSLLLWCPFMAFVLFKNHRSQYLKSVFPHPSVFAYLAIVILSVAFAANPARGLSFSVKLALTFIAGFTLFSVAIRDAKSLGFIYDLAFAAAMLTVTSCLVARFILSSEKCGFYDNPYKYGTYIGIFVPLSASYFFFSKSRIRTLLACVLVVLALLSAGTFGAAVAISIAMVAMLLAAKRTDARLSIAASLVIGLALAVLMNLAPNAPLKNDMRLAESDSPDLRQRYIEWQAEVNLLEERAVVGTGAGSVNDYRSNFYYQLPKLNTLASFDQNGWLATAAETGIVGLLCFCWIITQYGKQVFRQLQKSGLSVAPQFAISNFVGLLAACVANMFSSVHYNGILIVFVLVLALVSRTCYIFGEAEQ